MQFIVAYFLYLNRLTASQLVTLLLDSKLTSVLCHFGDFGCGDGGWTPVMKIDGNKARHKIRRPKGRAGVLRVGRGGGGKTRDGGEKTFARFTRSPSPSDACHAG